jgi:hypothetical protein
MLTKMVNIYEDNLERCVRQKNSWFAQYQEAYNKDVERSFSVLQARFAIVRYSTLTWSKAQMWKIMNACVIIENEREHPVLNTEPYHWQGPPTDVDHRMSTPLTAFLARRQEI